jgi:cation:H+ antiporter
MRMNATQVEEVFLTAAQSLFAVAVIANLSITRWEAVGLLVLFLGQFGFASTEVRYGFAFGYVGLTVIILAVSGRARRGLWDAIRNVFRPGSRPLASTPTR